VENPQITAHIRQYFTMVLFGRKMPIAITKSKIPAISKNDFAKLSEQLKMRITISTK
tara:strand:+ start:542 stop:712 length:171 start_codon:yes stop_codon:yes gene_type:complete